MMIMVMMIIIMGHECKGGQFRGRPRDGNWRKGKDTEG
jgi:hypothetical protein